MFDLFRSREKSVRILLGALLVLVALSMLTYLVPNYNTGQSSTDLVVAQIGKDEITLPDVQRRIQSTLRGRQLPPEMLPNFIPQFVDQLVTERAVAYQADRLGFQVTDKDVADAIRMALPGLYQDGRFIGKEAYASMLAQQNFTMEEFENEMRRQVLMTRMRDVALEGTLVSPQELELAYRQRNEKVKIQFVKLTPDKYKAEIQPTPAEMQEYFKANASRYTVPEKRNLVVLIADQSKIEQSLNPPEADLRRMYTQNQDQFRTGETVDLRHILLKTEGKPPADDAKIKAQAQDLLKQIRNGANFAELAKKYSEDPGSASKGGEYDGVQHGQMVPEFDKAAFALKPGETSDLVKTQYGYHIIQVIRKQEARLKPFDEVKAQLADEWKKQRVNDIMQSIGDKVQAAFQKDAANPEKVAAEFNMQVARYNGIAAGSALPDIGASPDFDQATAGLKKGEVSAPVAIAGNKIVIAEVTDIIPAHPNTFDEVQNQVRDAIVQTRVNVAVQKHAQDLLEKTKAMGGDLEKAAKSLGLEVKTSSEFGRSGTVDGLGSATYVMDAFSKPDGSVLGPIALGDGTAVAKVVAHIPADMSKLPEQRASLRDELRSQKARDRNSLFEAGIKDQLIKEGKLKIHQNVIDRLIASYRG